MHVFLWSNASAHKPWSSRIPIAQDWDYRDVRVGHQVSGPCAWAAGHQAVLSPLGVLISSSATHGHRTCVCFPTGSNMSPFNRKTQLTAKVQRAWQAIANPQLRHKEHDSSTERTLGTQSHYEVRDTGMYSRQSHRRESTAVNVRGWGQK